MMYYKIGVLNVSGNLIDECVTEVPLHNQKVLGKVMDLLKEKYDGFVDLVYNQCEGKMPSKMSVIKVQYEEPYLKYNK